MLEILSESHGNILGVRATGTFSHQEYHEFLLPHLSTIIKEHGRVRLLFYLGEDFRGLDLEALKNEAFGHEHQDDFQKIAMVGGSWWLSLQMTLLAPFLNGEVRNFAREELPEAWSWIRA